MTSHAAVPLAQELVVDWWRRVKHNRAVADQVLLVACAERVLLQ